MPNANIVEQIPVEERLEISRRIIEDYDADISDRAEWEEKRNRWYKLWACIRDKKDFPWPGASNVCIPMLATACNQFHARSYQAVFAPPGMVKALPMGKDDIKSARRIEKFLNWQTQHDMEEYEEVFDELLQLLPINGVAFKKLYWDSEGDKPISEYISALDIVIPYKTKRLRKGRKQAARRLVHRLWKHYEDINDNIDNGYYHWDMSEYVALSEDSENKDLSSIASTAEEVEGIYNSRNTENPHLILECHKKLKLNDDEERKPYIFTVDYDTGILLRVTSRMYGDIELCHFIDYHFIPNPESFYSLGFGHFLENLNEMANTAFNQIFDGGSMSNIPFMFYERKAGIKKRDIKLRPGGSFEVRDASAIKFPQMQRIDQILFQVLGITQQYTEMFTSTSEYLSGRESKGTKTPTAHGTLAIIEQGLVTFAVMTKRTFRSLERELRLISDLNQINLKDDKEFMVMDGDKVAFPDIKKNDFKGHYRVSPIGDPSYASKGSRRSESIELYNLLSGGMGGSPNPFIWGTPGNPETGEGGQPPNMEAIWALTDDVLDSYDKPNKRTILPELPETPVSPEEENAMFAQGDYEAPKQGENHQEHIAIHMAFKQHLVYAQMSDDYKELLERHIMETAKVQYLEAAQQQQLGGEGGQQIG